MGLYCNRWKVLNYGVHLLSIDDGKTQIYQEILHGVVQHYKDLDGNILYKIPPTGVGPEVVDANPKAPTWALPDPIEIPDTPPVPEKQIVTKLAFYNRFTPEEKIALEMAQLDNPLVDISVRQIAATIRVLQKSFDLASVVDLLNGQLKAGMDNLEQLGVIKLGRAAIIYGTPPSAEELSSA